MCHLHVINSLLDGCYLWFVKSEASTVYSIHSITGKCLQPLFYAGDSLRTGCGETKSQEECKIHCITTHTHTHKHSLETDSPVCYWEHVLLIIDLFRGVSPDVAEHDRELLNEILEDVYSLRGEGPSTILLLTGIAKNLCNDQFTSCTHEIKHITAELDYLGIFVISPPDFSWRISNSAQSSPFLCSLHCV